MRLRVSILRIYSLWIGSGYGSTRSMDVEETQSSYSIGGLITFKHSRHAVNRALEMLLNNAAQLVSA